MKKIKIKKFFIENTVLDFIFLEFSQMMLYLKLL